jgi:hypothetical protein
VSISDPASVFVQPDEPQRRKGLCDQASLSQPVVCHARKGSWQEKQRGGERHDQSGLQGGRDVVEPSLSQEGRHHFAQAEHRQKAERAGGKCRRIVSQGQGQRAWEAHPQPRRQRHEPQA